MRNPEFKVGGVNYETAADLTGQANHIGATIGADILKQKLPNRKPGLQGTQRGRLLLREVG
jgi:class I fructose-bisphosphate aldolase